MWIKLCKLGSILSKAFDVEALEIESIELFFDLWDNNSPKRLKVG